VSAGKDFATSAAHDLGMEGQRVLVVDDEPMMREVLTRYLERDGFLVRTAADGPAAVASLESELPSLVLLDLMLPGMDGLEVLGWMRKGALKSVPVILVTAKGEETDRIVGLELGADDYVTKPFSPREVVARVRAVLRRADSALDTRARAQAVLEFGTCRLDLGRRVLEIDGAPVRITRKEFDLLEMLASQPGRVFSRSQLLEEVWDFAWDGDSSTITVHVRRLREKIEPVPSDPRHILTVWGVGYRFEP
jgi:DNA-binding response OmpR family regulator